VKKIEDRVLLGVISGILGSTIVKIINPIEYNLGLTDLRYNQPAASLFLSKRDVVENTAESKVIASAVNNAMAAATGTIITYMLTASGRDYAMLKGAGFGLLQWIGIWGFLSRVGVTLKSHEPLTHILSIIDHSLFGASVGFLISRLGDDRLFPDGKRN